MRDERETTQDARDLPAPRRALRLGIALSLVLACVAPLASFLLFFPFVDNIPKWDQWSLIEVWEAHYQGQPVLPLLLKPYNGHLNVLPRFIFYGLGLLTHWNLRAEVLLSYILALGTAATLLLMLRDSNEKLLLLMAAPVAAAVFSLNQFENFLSGYPMGQILSQLGVTLTVFALTRPRLTARHAVAGAAAAAVATFSWGAGLVSWPLGVLALAFRREGRRMLIPWCGLTLAALLTVKHGAGPVGQMGFRALLDFDTAFFLAMLGRPIGYRAFPTYSTAVGLGLFLVVAFVLVLDQALRSRRGLPALRWGLLGLSSLLAAVMITLARAKSGPDQALISHYCTAAYPLVVAVLVLACQALLAWRGTARSGLQRAAAVLLVAALLVLPLAVVYAQSKETFQILWSWEQASRVHDRKLLAGTITEAEIRSSMHPEAELVRRGITLLRARRLAIFAGAPR